MNTVSFFSKIALCDASAKGASELGGKIDCATKWIVPAKKSGVSQIFAKRRRLGRADFIFCAVLF
ncbi:MAG: hypothetical protein DBX55_08860 [Verrucomicrobia bacterium]|nr:MAG: hypothetical protein DBX55_08860 [Verrucomicrobiota bacterium]